MAQALSRKYLENLREVQASRCGPNHTGPAVRNATAPDYCLGAAKFVAAKLLGFFPEAAHLNDVIRKSAKEKHGPRELDSKSAWGTISKTDAFNTRVLPAALALKLGAPAALRGSEKPEFVFMKDSFTRADELLKSGVPLVVGVGLGGSSGRDHFIAMVMDTTDNRVWAIDSWEDRDDSTTGVFEVSGWKSFSTQLKKVELEAGLTTIPATNHSFFGYYIGAKTKTPFRLK